MCAYVRVFVLPLCVIKSNGERAIIPPPHVSYLIERGLFDRAILLLILIPVVVVVASSFVFGIKRVWEGSGVLLLKSIVQTSERS